MAADILAEVFGIKSSNVDEMNPAPRCYECDLCRKCSIYPVRMAPYYFY